MDFNSLMPLLMLMSGMRGGQNGNPNGGANGADYGEMMKALGGGGGNPMEMLMSMMGGGDPRIKQMMALMQTFQTMNAPVGAGTAAAEEKPPEKKPINELKPIRHIAPDRIHNSMDAYLRKSRRIR